MQRCLIFLSLCCGSLWAQTGQISTAGARSAALSHSSVVLTDLWAAHHNPAALAFSAQSAFACSYQRRYGLKELQEFQLAAALKKGKSAWGLALDHFGFADFQHSWFGLSYALKVHSRLAIGGRVQLERQLISEFGVALKPSATLGLYAELNDHLQLGFSLYNIWGQDGFFEEAEAIPLMARLGLRYRFNHHFSWSHEYSQGHLESGRYSTGIEYQFHSQLCLRSGLLWHDDLGASAGLGLKVRAYELNLAYQFRQRLGNQMVYSLQFHF
jgi:hypothetical protein